jgi:hypothetical protein
VSATAALTLTPVKGVNVCSHRRPILINHTKVPNTDQVNFAVPISGVYSFLANVANGGEVQNTNGYDIIFTSDCAGLQQLNHQIESYDRHFEQPDSVDCRRQGHLSVEGLRRRR